MNLRSKECLGCGRKLNFFTIFKEVYYENKDKDVICRECANAVFPDNKTRKTLHNNKVINWFQAHNSIEFLHYYNKGATLSIDRKGNVTGEELFCPFCGSEDVTPLSKHREGFSAGKAVAGAVLAGGVGALAGFAGESSSKVDWLCNDCHKAFTK